MLKGLCRRILADKQMWSKAKLFAAAALSMINMCTYILMMFEFMREEKTGFAHIMTGSIFVNLGLQLGMVIFQNFKLGWRKALTEVLIALTCINPGVDAFRVASETEIVEGQTVDPKAEMAFNKSVELFAEASPGTVAQMAAIMNTGSNTSSNAAFGFACCVLTAALPSSNMSIDWDTSKKKRKTSPSIYGYVPDKEKEKVLVFSFLCFLSAFNLLTRALTCVLLQLKGGVGACGESTRRRASSLLRRESAEERHVVLDATLRG